MFIVGGNYGYSACAGLAFLDRTSNGVVEQLKHSFAYAEFRNEKNQDETSNRDDSEIT